MRAHPPRACLALMLCLCAAAAQADDDLFYLLAPEDLGCLRDHAAEYAPQGSATSFITVADCGTGTASSGSLLDQVLNSAPDISTSDGSDTASDAIVALSAADFDCLATLEIPSETSFVAFYPEECNVEPR